MDAVPNDRSVIAKYIGRRRCSTVAVSKTAALQTPMQVREIIDGDAFERLQEPWNELATRVSRSVFLQHQWFSAAWAWRRYDAAPWILCVYAGNTLVGVLPLMRLHKSHNGARVVEFVSIPDTQCCDLLVEPERAAQICEVLVDYLLAKSGEWDALRLERLPTRSMSETLLQPLLQTRAAACRVDANDRNLFIALDGTWEDYYTSRSLSFKKSFRLAANRMTRMGRFQVERVTSNELDAEGMERLLEDALTISSRSWKRRTGTTLDVAGPRAFIQNLTRSACTRDWLSVWLLRIHDRPVAMEYQLVYDEQVYALRSDFDDEYKAVSPGSYLSRHLVEELFSNGFKRYYMGPGSNAYKKRWSEDGALLHSLQAYAPTLRGRSMALWANAMKAKLRTLRERLTLMVIACAGLTSMLEFDIVQILI